MSEVPCSSRTAYTNYGHRCDESREANAAYMRRYRATGRYQQDQRHKANAQRRARRARQVAS